MLITPHPQVWQSEIFAGPRAVPTVSSGGAVDGCWRRARLEEMEAVSKG
jgi:hypothetical protein